MQFARFTLEQAVPLADWRVAAPWVGLTALVVVSGAGILRTAVILHNKRMLREPEAAGIPVPGWRYATVVMCVSLAVDAALLAGVIVSSGQLRAELILLTFAMRLPVHAAVLARLLAASYGEAMIVQIFEIAIVMTLTPLVAALIGVALAIR
jgi:hypothetical protein